MRKLISVFTMFMMLTACADEPVIVKSDTPSEDPESKPEIVEQENDDEEEADEFIEFTLPEEKIMINLKMIRILDSYLQTFQNRRQALEEMNLNSIDTGDKNHYILEFSCHETLCSYILLDQGEENRAYLIADLAKLIQALKSPDDTKMLFHFNRGESRPPLSDIVVMDMKKWEPLALHYPTTEEAMLDYNWPILAAEWNDDNSLSATVPDITEPSAENLKQWKNTEKPTKEVILKIK
ncbi:MAG TPA: hypothetical protein VK119_06280 [Bacillota bacterium]|nr:hypothetical protein [Bacillota bacterium]